MDSTALIKTILSDKRTLAQPNSYISMWNSWYKGKVPSFHRYYIYNGDKKTFLTRLSMKMAKKSCEDWASLLMNEKVSIGVKSQDLLNEELMSIDFYNKTNQSVEYGFALSMAGLTVEINDLVIEFPEDDQKKLTYQDVRALDLKNNDFEEIGTLKITEKTNIGLSVYSAKKIVPITFENGKCVECAFVQENTQYTQITAHLRNSNGKYLVLVAKVNNKSNTVEEKYAFEVDYPLFAIVHPQIVNNIEIDDPYPISIFANAIDTLKGIDLMFDSYANEFNLGRKRIFVSTEMDQIDKETGKTKRNFDPNDVVIHQIPAATDAAGNPKPLIYEANGSLRAPEHSQAIQDMLNYYSSQVGLGVDYYRFEKGRVQTATQVISEKSDTFRNLKKHEGVFEKALHTILTALMYAHNEFTLSSKKYEDIEAITIKFDDSIIEDKNTEKTSDQKDIDIGAMSLVAYRMKWMAEDEETAKKAMKEIYGDANLIKRLQNFTPYLTQGTMTPLQFVKNVYLDITQESEQIKLAEEIKASLKASTEVLTDEDIPGLYNPPEEK